VEHLGLFFGGADQEVLTLYHDGNDKIQEIFSREVVTALYQHKLLPPDSWRLTALLPTSAAEFKPTKERDFCF